MHQASEKTTYVRQLTPEALRGLAAADAKDAEVLMQARAFAHVMCVKN